MRVKEFKFFWFIETMRNILIFNSAKKTFNAKLLNIHQVRIARKKLFIIFICVDGWINEGEREKMCVKVAIWDSLGRNSSMVMTFLNEMIVELYMTQF